MGGIIRETDLLVENFPEVGTVTTTIGPQGLTEIVLDIKNDSFSVTEVSNPEGETPGVNYTVVRVTGRI